MPYLVRFYSLLSQIVANLNIAEPDERETNQFDDLRYIFIDDPVSSLDENHLIELAVNLGGLIKEARGLKFIVSTHNPLFSMFYSTKQETKLVICFKRMRMVPTIYWKRKETQIKVFHIITI